MKKLLIFGFALCLCWAAFAQRGAAQADKPSPWTPDDIVQTEQASDARLSPDCRRIVWVKSTPDKEKDVFVSNLMLTTVDGKQTIELTRGNIGSSSPRWSPDGSLLAFITSRPSPNGKPMPDGPRSQIWLFNTQGGEPYPLTESTRGVSGYAWIDNENIAFLAQEDPTLYETSLKEKKDGSVVVDDEPHEPPVRLFTVSLKTKKVVRLTDNTDRIRRVTVSPDGAYAVTSHERSLRYVYDQKIKAATFLTNLKTGEQKQIFTEPMYNVGGVEWARDGKSFYAVSQTSSHPVYVNATIAELFTYEVATGGIAKVNLDWERGLAGDLAATKDGFIALLADGARHKLARYTRTAQGWQRAWLTGEHASNVFSFDLGQDDQTFAYQYTTASTPEQWFVARLGGDALASPAQVTSLNPQLKKKTIAKTEVIRWKGALDEEVEGILFYPHNYEAGKKYPLVVMIHGGPAGADFDAWADRWAYPHNLYAQRGAFILKPNYHGSSNYGLKWVESIGGGKYYDLEVPDIERGVDSLIARGLVDPNKLGTMGWSNGSILTTALTVTTTRYKAASAGAGDVDWASDWGNCAFGASFDNYYFGKTPLEDPQLYIKKSPFYRMDKVTTPTIIFHGTEDRQVPTQQSWMHYRALQQLGKTDVRFILFPGELHGLRKISFQRRKIAEEVAWFDKHLFGTAKEENEAFKPDSPLAVALKLKDAKRDGALYGTPEKGALVPETVARDKFEIGRFEVTRAQFARFDKTYQVAPGTENFPANNVTFDQAKAYCEWLSKTTGRTYRLGKDSEVEGVYGAPAASENTLDFWAGYSVNPDDTARLMKKIAELGRPAALLREVGSFKGAGSEGLLFDIGGNVAEWVIAADGSGKTLGGSADLPADARMRSRKPAGEYTGFRVVMDK